MFLNYLISSICTQISKPIMLMLRNSFFRAEMLPELLFYNLALGSDTYKKYFSKYIGSASSLYICMNHSLGLLT